MKTIQKLALLITLSLSLIFLLFAYINPAKMLGTASLILGIAGILQLEITDFFESITKAYGDEKNILGVHHHT